MKKKSVLIVLFIFLVPSILFAVDMMLTPKLFGPEIPHYEDSKIRENFSCENPLSAGWRGISQEKFIWGNNVRFPCHLFWDVAARRTSRIRNWIELIFMLGFIYYMLYDIYKNGDLDTIIKFLKTWWHRPKRAHPVGAVQLRLPIPWKKFAFNRKYDIMLI